MDNPLKVASVERVMNVHEDRLDRLDELVATRIVIDGHDNPRVLGHVGHGLIEQGGLGLI